MTEPSVISERGSRHSQLRVYVGESLCALCPCQAPGNSSSAITPRPPLPPPLPRHLSAHYACALRRLVVARAIRICQTSERALETCAERGRFFHQTAHGEEAQKVDKDGRESAKWKHTPLDFSGLITTCKVVSSPSGTRASAGQDERGRVGRGLPRVSTARVDTGESTDEGSMQRGLV